MKKWLFLALLAIPVMAWMLFKPARVLAPGWVGGVTCPTETLCLDDAARLTEATRLYEDAVAFVESEIDAFESRPRVTFCSTDRCFRSFGFNRAAGQTVGRSGIVIGTRGWQDYYLRHEMIHYMQAEKMGVIGQWRSDDWFKEGMAYALSLDPRTTLPEPMQTYRRQFEKWYASVGKDRLWEAARQLY
jgi:hypothetical protein